MSINVKNILYHEIAFVFYVIFLYKITYYYLIGALFHFGWNFYIFDFEVEGFEGIYHNFSFFLASFNNLLVTIPLLIIYAFIYKFKDKFTWNEISKHQLYKPTKYFLIFVVAFTTWFYSFSAYNYYFDRLFLFDRLLLVFCFILLFRTPKILPLFILLTVLWVTQFSHPLGNNSITDKKIIYEMMIVFLSFISINSFKKINLNYLWVIIFALIGTNYFIPAIAKLLIAPNLHEWITENDLIIHVISSYERGWLATFSNEFRISLLKLFNELNYVILITTMVFELGALFILKSRKIAITLCILFSIFHLGIFIESGIFFWKWISFNLFITFLLIKYKDNFSDIFQKKYFYLSIVLIMLSPILFNAVYLGWWDNNLKYSFKYFVVTENNDTLQISGNQLAPYNQNFTFGRHQKIVPNELYFHYPSTTDYIAFDSLKTINNNLLYSYIKDNDKNEFDSLYYNKFDNFVKTYFNNFNKREYNLNFLSVFPHIWTTKYPNNKFKKKQKVKEFYILLNTYYVYNNIDNIKIDDYNNTTKYLNNIENNIFKNNLDIIGIDTIYKKRFMN